MSFLSWVKQSRKAKIVLVDFSIAIISYFSAKYLAPTLVEDILFLIGAMQPVVALLIYGIATEDAAKAK